MNVIRILCEDRLYEMNIHMLSKVLKHPDNKNKIFYEVVNETSPQKMFFEVPILTNEHIKKLLPEMEKMNLTEKDIKILRYRDKSRVVINKIVSSHKETKALLRKIKVEYIDKVNNVLELPYCGSSCIVSDEVEDILVGGFVSG